jgi:hypothetical protein
MKKRIEPNRTSGRHSQVPSHDPMPGVDDKPIDTGATSGAQLPPKRAAESSQDIEKDKTGLNPNQGDLLTPFWPRK